MTDVHSCMLYNSPKHVVKISNSSGKQKWRSSSDDCVSDVTKNSEGKLAEANQQLCVKVSTPETVRYRAELDTTQSQ